MPAPTSVPAVLRAAADLIEPEGRWVQGFWATTKRGRAIGYEEANAACWCAVGALMRVSRSAPLDLWYPTRDALERVIDHQSIPGWNDAPDRTQAEVVAALRRAADLAEAEQAVS
jgi:hypothetical protein